MTSRGLVNTFGVFQEYYATSGVFTASQSAIAWLGSIQGFLMLTIGVLCGRAVDAGYLRINLIAGIATTVFGMMMVSICREYWQFVLAQGVVAGLGSGAAFIPSVTVVGTYFSTRRSLAIGIATTGSSIGTPSHTHIVLGSLTVFILLRRHHISHCFAKTHFADWFRVGSSRDGIYHARDPAPIILFNEVSSPT